MSKRKWGYPKYGSRFICLSCMKENQLGAGIQRIHGQREEGHIKEAEGMSPTTLETRKHIISGFWSYLSRLKKCDISRDFQRT